MKSKIKKLSIILYCNNNFDETKETLYSILDQNLSHLFYDVLILNDNANSAFTKKINNLIKKEELVNFHIYSLDFYNGLPMSFNFLLKNNIINTKYFTIIKSGDVWKDDYLSNFLNNLYSLDKDLYMNDLKEELIIERSDFNEKGKKYDIIKSRMNISSLTGLISQDEALTSKPIFLGKIWRTSSVLDIFIVDDKILFQDIYMYIQMVYKCKDIWYEGKIAGTTKHKPWIPQTMDKKRIELLCLMLNRTISRNPYINGQVLQFLALAINNSPKNLKLFYLLRNHKYLKNNFIIVPLYGMSKRKVIKLTKAIVEFGEYQQQKSREEKRREKYEEKMKKKKLKQKRKDGYDVNSQAKDEDFALEHESYSL